MSDSKEGSSKKGRVPCLPPCKVCGERGTGFHYGVTTCGACKGFFQRSLIRLSPYKCLAGSGHCFMGPDSERRRRCPKCRLDRCYTVGMCKDAIKMGRYSYEKRTRDVVEMVAAQGSSDWSSSASSSSEESQTSSPNSVKSSERMDNSELTESPSQNSELKSPRNDTLLSMLCQSNQRNLSQWAMELGGPFNETKKQSPSNTMSDSGEQLNDGSSTVQSNEKIIQWEDLAGSPLGPESQSPPENRENVDEPVSTIDLRKLPELASRNIYLPAMSYMKISDNLKCAIKRKLHANGSDQGTPPACEDHPDKSPRYVENMDKESHYDNNSNLNTEDLTKNYIDQNVSPAYSIDQAIGNNNTHLSTPRKKMEVKENSYDMTAESAESSYFRPTHGSPCLNAHQDLALADGALNTSHSQYQILSHERPTDSVFICEDESQAQDSNEYNTNMFSQHYGNPQCPQYPAQSNFSQVSSTSNEAGEAMGTVEDYRSMQSEINARNTWESNNTVNIPVYIQEAVQMPTDAEFSYMSPRENYFPHYNAESNDFLPNSYPTPESVMYESRSLQNSNFTKHNIPQIGKDGQGLPQHPLFEHFPKSFDYAQPDVRDVYRMKELRECVEELSRCGVMSYENILLQPFVEPHLPNESTRQPWVEKGFNMNNIDNTTQEESTNEMSEQNLPWCEFSEGELDRIMSRLQRSHEASIGNDLNQVPLEVMRRKEEVYSRACSIRSKLCGERALLDNETFFNIFDVTGIDVDQRLELLEVVVPRYERFIHRIVRFFKSIPGYRSISTEDRVVLAKASVYYCHFLGSFKGFSREGNFYIDECDIARQLPEFENLCSGSELLMSTLKILCSKLDEAKLSVNEIILLKAILMTLPEKGEVADFDRIEYINWRLRCCFILTIRRTRTDPDATIAVVTSTIDHLRSVKHAFLTIFTSSFRKLLTSVDAPLFSEIVIAPK